MTITETMAAAERASAAQKWSEAASLWERVYQARQTGPTNLKLVTALVNDKQYLAASTYAAEAEALYLASDSAADLYLTALLKSHQFVPARILRCDRAAASATWRSRALTLIESAEAQAEATLQTTLTTTMRQFYHLSDQPVAAQTERLQAARHLTYAKYLTAAQFLLVDPFLHQLSRVEVLYTLRAMGVSGSVKIRTLKGTELAVVPSALPEMGQDPASLAVLSALQAQLGQSDVGLYDGLEGLLSLQLMYLYPEAAEIITDPQAWVRFFIGQQTGHLSEKERAAEPAIAQIQERIQELNRELQN